jgi:hypothetical protein
MGNDHENASDQWRGLLYTLLTLAAICLAKLGPTPQNVPF